MTVAVDAEITASMQCLPGYRRGRYLSSSNGVTWLR